MTRKMEIGRFVLETVAPLSIGTGFSELGRDVALVRDVHGLPTIPGSSLAGAVRAKLPHLDAHFGNSNTADEEGAAKTRHKSNVFIGWAHIHGQDNKPFIGLAGADFGTDSILNTLCDGAITRDHVRMNEKGVAHDKSKFDRSAVHTGARFTFDIWVEMAEADEVSCLGEIMSVLNSGFRLGGATRAGYGRLRLLDADTRILDLADEDQRKALQIYRDPRQGFPKGKSITAGENSAELGARLVHRSITLVAEDYWRTGAQQRRHEQQEIPITYEEDYIDWADGKGNFKRKKIMPASGIKGPLRHRTLFHLNRLRMSSGKEQALDADLMELFGSHKDGDEGRAGRVFIDDGIVSGASVTKVLQHTSIDRFSGGVRDGVLFAEEVIWQPKLEVSITVEDLAQIDDDLLMAFDMAIADLRGGRLALGAASAKGHGYFTGEGTYEPFAKNVPSQKGADHG